MAKSILDNLIEKNEFPIIFIGAGISKRYLENYPSWEQLLESLWNVANDTNLYSYINKVNENLKAQGINNEFKRKFIANTLVASTVEKEFYLWLFILLFLFHILKYSMTLFVFQKV